MSSTARIILAAKRDSARDAAKAGAILNGVHAAASMGTATSIACATQPHVRDFLAQKFGVAILQSSDDLTRAALMVLFKSITGEELE